MVFRLRLKFYPSSASRLQEPLTRYLVYLQLKRDLLAGRLRCACTSPAGQTDVAPTATAAYMAALVLQVELGDCCHSTRTTSAASMHHKRYNPHSCSSSTHRLPATSCSSFIHRFPATSCPCRLTAALAVGCDVPPPAVTEARCRLTRGLTVGQAETALIRRATQLNTYGTRLHPFKDHRGVLVCLGVNYSGICVLNGVHRLRLFRWHEVQKVNFENRMFILHLVYGDDSRNRTKTTMGYKSASARRCRQFWREACEHRFFFTYARHRCVPRVVFGGSLLCGHSRLRFTGRTERQMTNQIIRREPPRFKRYGLPLRTSRSPHRSVSVSPCRSRQTTPSACGVGGTILETVGPELDGKLTIDESVLVCVTQNISLPLTPVHDTIYTNSVTGTLGSMSRVGSVSRVGPVSRVVAVSGAGSVSEGLYTALCRHDLQRSCSRLAVPCGVLCLPSTDDSVCVLPCCGRAGERGFTHWLWLVGYAVFCALLAFGTLVVAALAVVFELNTDLGHQLASNPQLRYLHQHLYRPIRDMVC